MNHKQNKIKMNATQHHIGKNKTSQRTKTKVITPTVRRICRMDETVERYQRNKERQAEICSDKSTSNGFLKCTFLPKLKETETAQYCENTAKTEKDFYQSLSKLSEHYGINPKTTQGFEFPYNIALALDDVQNQLKYKVENWEEIRLMEDKNQTYFICEERYNTGQTLYYIPIIPLYRLSKNSKRKKAAQLLQSVCYYLYHITGVPYYRKQETYLFWMYEMVAEWLVSDEDNEELLKYQFEIKQAEQLGDFMEQKIYNHHNLSRFKNFLNHFKAKNNFDKDCFDLATKVFTLYEQYPNATIFRNSQPNGESNECERDFILSMDKYVSFCADAKGELFQSLFETVNAEFQECNIMEEPSVIKRFNGSPLTNNNLDFENRLFPLIEELIYILNNF